MPRQATAHIHISSNQLKKKSQMKLYEILKYYQKVFADFGRLKGKNKEAKIKRIATINCAVSSLLIYSSNSKRKGNKSLISIIEDLTKTNSFKEVTKLNAILAILLFEFNKDILLQSKNIISLNNSITNVKAEQENVIRSIYSEIITSNKHIPYHPEKRKDANGLSLVLFFDYPNKFKKRIENSLGAIENKIWTTKQHHLTIFNIGTAIPTCVIDQIESYYHDKIKSKLEENTNFCKSVNKVLSNATIDSNLNLLPDGSIVLFGSGELLKAMHKLRVKLRKSIISVDLGKIFEYDAQPVWIHTAFARIVKKPDLTNFESFVNKAIVKEDLKGESLKNVRFGLMRFEDKKAMMETENCIIKK